MVALARLLTSTPDGEGVEVSRRLHAWATLLLLAGPTLLLGFPLADLGRTVVAPWMGAVGWAASAAVGLLVIGAMGRIAGESGRPPIPGWKMALGFVFGWIAVEVVKGLWTQLVFGIYGREGNQAVEGLPLFLGILGFVIYRGFGPPHRRAMAQGDEGPRT